MTHTNNLNEFGLIMRKFRNAAGVSLKTADSALSGKIGKTGIE